MITLPKIFGYLFSQDTNTTYFETPDTIECNVRVRRIMKTSDKPVELASIYRLLLGKIFISFPLDPFFLGGGVRPKFYSKCWSLLATVIPALRCVYLLRFGMCTDV
jgi:hypothetical protein